MNLKKSIVSIILVCALGIMGIGYTTTGASTKGMLIGSSISGQPGDTVDVVVSLWNNPGITSIVLNFEYNSEILELVKIQDAQLLSERAVMTTSPELTANPYRVIWMVGTSDSVANGKLATLTFKIKDTAVEGKYAVNLTFNEDDIYNTALENVEFGVINAGVIVEKPGESGNPDLGNTEMPSATPEPGNSEIPPATPEPGNTEIPPVTMKPDNSEIPSVTPEPGNSEIPPVTSKPDNSEIPSVTSEPGNSEIPPVTPKPDNSEIPPVATEPGVSQSPEYRLGDVNHDGNIELLDAQMALRIALKITPADINMIKRGDINGNNMIDLSDAQAILKEALKITNGFK